MRASELDLPAATEMTSQLAKDNLPSEKIVVRGVNWLGDAVMTTQRWSVCVKRGHTRTSLC